MGFLRQGTLKTGIWSTISTANDICSVYLNFIIIIYQMEMARKEEEERIKKQQEEEEQKRRIEQQRRVRTHIVLI